MTHLHLFDAKPDQRFDDMCYCTLCGWGTTKASIVRSMTGCSIPKVKSTQLTDRLSLNLFSEKEQ